MKKILCYVMLFLGIWGMRSTAQVPDTALAKLLAMNFEDLLNAKVSIATKTAEPIGETPAVVSVITAVDIKNMGAVNLNNILQTVPGFEVITQYQGYNSIGIRGVKNSRNASQLLVLIDGIPFNGIFRGSMNLYNDPFSIDVIERMEIIRGPGSALYGRNAFSGVINIITKNAKTDNDYYIKASIGDFDTKRLSGYYGYSKDLFHASISFENFYSKRNDAYFVDGPRAGRWDLHSDNYFLHSTIGYGDFTLTGFYKYEDNGGGITKNYVVEKAGNMSLQYKHNISADITVHAKIFGHLLSHLEDIEEFYPGASPAYPLGLYYQPISHEYSTGAEAEMHYRTSHNNTLLCGIQNDFHGVYDMTINANIDFRTYTPLPGIDRNNQVPYQPGWFTDGKRDYTNTAVYIQDIWNALEELTFTLGGRYDVDSEIGGIINPRCGVVWQPIERLTLKALYGKAYRAPSPEEQYKTIGFAIGNKDLKPEKINTFEFSASYYSENTKNTISVFHNTLTDLIYAAIINTVDPNNKYYNVGKNTSVGIEYENKTVWSRKLSSFFNFSYTKSENTERVDNRDSVYNHKDVAPFKINFGVDYTFLKCFHANLNMFYRSKMERFLIPALMTEVQDPIGDYATFNCTLRAEKLFNHLEASVSLYNMFDKKYYPQDNQHLHLPPEPGRQFLLSLAYVI